VIIADNLSNSNYIVVTRIEEITNRRVTPYFIDLLNKNDLDIIFKENHIGAVIHFMGYKSAGESVEKPIKYSNLISTLNLCEVMEDNDVLNFIFSSSATVYGKPESNPVKNPFQLKRIIHTVNQN
jgi:UDP-glucose 4-epimerase